MSEILAGLSRLTILNLKYAEDDEYRIDFGGPDEEGKHVGWILSPLGRPLLNTQPIFESGEAAKNHMREIVKACREFDDDLSFC